MKLSAGFDPRRLRTGHGRWRKRLCVTFSILLFLFGLVVLISSVLALSNHPALAVTSPSQAISGLILGLVLTALGLWLWRRCRRHSPNGGLDFAPHLLKQR